MKKDGTKIIDNFETITILKGYLITSTYKLDKERIEKINEEDLKKIAIPIREIHKVINNSISLKKRKLLGEDDVIWQSKTKKNNHKKKVWVKARSEKKTVVLPDGKLALLELLVEGKCDLYFDINSGFNFDINTNLVYGIAPTPPEALYYFKRKGEPRSTLYKGRSKSSFSNNLEYVRSKQLKYFDECPKAKDFITKQKLLSKSQVIETVKLYNNYCGL